MPDFGGVLGSVLGWAALVVVLGLIFAGLLDPKRVADQLRIDIDAWKAALAAEREAHADTRAALAAEQRRADAAVAHAQAAVALLEAAR